MELPIVSFVQSYRKSTQKWWIGQMGRMLLLAAVHHGNEFRLHLFVNPRYSKAVGTALVTEGSDGVARNLIPPILIQQVVQGCSSLPRPATHLLAVTHCHAIAVVIRHIVGQVACSLALLGTATYGVVVYTINSPLLLIPSALMYIPFVYELL